MTIKVFPVTFEGYEEDEPVFTVKAFDECAAEVTITSLVNVASWDEISVKVRECLVAMDLKP